MNRLLQSFTGLAAVALLALLASPLLANNVVARVKSVAADRNQVVVTDQNGKDWTFQVGQNAQIRDNNRDSKLADLRPGQQVNVIYQVQNNGLVASEIRLQQAQPAAQQAQATKQPAQQAQQGQQAAQQGQRDQQAQHQVRGKIQNVAADQHQFTIRDQKDRDWTFRAGRDAKVQVNGKEARLADLKQGQEVTVSYRQMLTDIRAGRNDATAAPQQPKGQTVNGKIQRVDATQHQLALRDQNGKEHMFQVGQNARVQVDGKNANLADLQQGQEVTATRQLVANDIRVGAQNDNQNR
jgi:phosphotransferase system IIA component